MINIHTSMNRREKVLACVTIALALVYILVYLIILPWKNLWQELERQILIERKEHVRLIKNVKELQKDLRNSSGIYQEFLSMEQMKKLIPQLLTQLESMSQSVGIRLSNVKPHAPRPTPHGKNWSVELSLQGPADNVLHFIHLSQQAPLEMNVSALEIEHTGSAEDVRGRLTLDLLFLDKIQGIR